MRMIVGLTAAVALMGTMPQQAGDQGECGNDARINVTIPATDSTMKTLGKPNTAAATGAWPTTIALFRATLGQ